jgi:hypothetical protein
MQYVMLRIGDETMQFKPSQGDAPTLSVIMNPMYMKRELLRKRDGNFQLTDRRVLVTELKPLLSQVSGFPEESIEIINAPHTPASVHAN